MESDRAPIEALSAAPLTATKRRMVDALAHAYPRDVSMIALVEACYFDDIDGGPDNPHGVIRTYVSHLRRELQRFGWTIPNSKSGPGNYSRYALKPYEPAP